jgi:homoserine O-acetyltransferase
VDGVRQSAPAASRTLLRTGGWIEGDPVGMRLFLDLDGPVRLERGGALLGVRIAYETWGTLAPDAGNAVLVEHALTGDSHVVGAAGPGHTTAGWWPSLVGPGAPLDTGGLFVVCANVLGGCQGTTGPSSVAPDGTVRGSRFPEITVADQVAVEAALADALGIGTWRAVLGGSMGGMRALEWAVSRPDRVESLFFLASTAVASADQIGTQTTRPGPAATTRPAPARWPGWASPGGSPT